MKLRFYTIQILVFTTLIACAGCMKEYYIVRHAEKVDDSASSPLTEPGKQRALALRDLLIDNGIDCIYTSGFIRTNATAQPLADALRLPILVYDNNNLEAFTDSIDNPGSACYLIVGHSNKVDDIVRLLSHNQESISELDDNDFDNLFHLTVKWWLGTTTELEHSTYGAPSP